MMMPGPPSPEALFDQDHGRLHAHRAVSGFGQRPAHGTPEGPALRMGARGMTLPSSSVSFPLAVFMLGGTGFGSSSAAVAHACPPPTPSACSLGF